MKFKVIYADPAWRFKVWSRDTGMGRSADSHYQTMTLDAIKQLPVRDIADKDCALFLWATMPMLPEAIEVGKAWGFKYTTAGFAWAKTTKTGKWHIGMGYYTRANVELCLLFTRGRVPRLSKAVRQLVVAPVREHSRKPDEIYERIEALFPGAYCELFARNPRNGWTALGNGIDGRPLEQSIFTTALEAA